jgi:hypothetical protein
VKIIKSFQDVEFAKKNSHEQFSDKAFWFWGIDVEGNLYCKGQISGFVFAHNWLPTERLSKGLSAADIVRIHSNLLGSSND